jgi:hypothetical protein
LQRQYIWNFEEETMKKSGASQAQSAAELISKRIAELWDWRGETLSRMRKGALLKDPARPFNSSLDGNVRRAIDIYEGADVDESAFKALVRQAVALNSSGKSKPSRRAKS